MTKQNTFNIDEGQATQVANATADEKGPQIAGNIPWFWVKSGNKAMKAAHPVQYIGGLATGADDFDAVCEDYSLAHHP